MDNEKGLITKYVISKRVPCDCGADSRCKRCGGRGFTTQDVSPSAQYFVLRIDENDWHGEASRIALAAYAAMVEQHHRQFACDLGKWLLDQGMPLDMPFRHVAEMSAGKAARKRYEERCRELAKVKLD